jgi:membrane-bound ClpP family serine protease
MDIPTWVIILLAVIWAGKDAVMYPLVWRAYDDRTRDHMKSMIGERGTAMERLSPSGYISVEGESWRAEVGKGSQPVEKGAKVIVKDVKGLTLIVEADQEEL